MERFWLLYGRVHSHGEWPPTDTTGPYGDREAAVAAYDGGRGLPSAIAVTDSERRPTVPSDLIGLDGWLDSSGGS